MISEVTEEIKNYSLNQYKNNNNVKVHVTKLDYDYNFKYDTVCGVWVNGELTETYELENISNKEIDEFMREVQKLVRANTLYLI